MIQFQRKFDQFHWHCPHPCNCASGEDPKALRYSSVMHVLSRGSMTPVTAISLIITPRGGSIALHRTWLGPNETAADAKPCDLLGQCMLDKAISVGGEDATIPLRAIGPWRERHKQATFANLKAGSDAAMQFMIANAQSGAVAQPETFWHALQMLGVRHAAPILASGGVGP